MKNRELAIQGKGLPNIDFLGHFSTFFQFFFLIFRDVIFQMVWKTKITICEGVSLLLRTDHPLNTFLLEWDTDRSPSLVSFSTNRFKRFNDYYPIYCKYIFFLIQEIVDVSWYFLYCSAFKECLGVAGKSCHSTPLCCPGSTASHIGVSTSIVGLCQNSLARELDFVATILKISNNSINIL